MNLVLICGSCHDERHGGPVGGRLRGLGAYSPEAQAKKSISAKRNWQKPEFRARGLAVLEKAVEASHTPEVQARRAATNEARGFGAVISASMKRHWEDPEWRARAQANMKGKKRSAETRARMSAAKKGQKISDATRQKMAESHRALWADPEYRRRSEASAAKQREAIKAKWADPEYRARLSQKHKDAWARRRAATEASNETPS